jgi:hypothetical protein
MMYTSIRHHNAANLSIAGSPQSSSGSASLSSDESPSHSSVDYITGSGQLDYGHDLFDQLKVMFIPPSPDSLSCSSGGGAEMNHHFVIKQEHQPTLFYDSYQPYIDSCNESISYHPSQHPRTPDPHPEQVGSASMATPSFTFGFSNGFHNFTAPTSSPLAERVDLPGTNADYNLAVMRYSAECSSNVIAQQPCAQPIQLSPQCVQNQDLPPSPPLYTELPDTQVCNPRFVAGDEDDGRLSDVAMQMDTGRKRKRRDSSLSATSAAPTASPSSTYSGGQAFSDEEEHDHDSMEDGEYEDSGESETEVDIYDPGNDRLHFRPGRRTRSTRSTRTRRGTSSDFGPLSLSNSSLPYDPSDDEVPIMGCPAKSNRTLTAPVPVPNLTKKSRGRRVPTASSIVGQGGVQKNPRTYMCKVKDCGKCFARGEHLKRHVRSIHTNEKPHKCPFPGCNKDFSRHDNLGQHMRVHKN